MSGFGIGATWRWPVRRVDIRRNWDAIEADETGEKLDEALRAIGRARKR